MFSFSVFEDKIKDLNLTEALESNRNHKSFFALTLLSQLIGWDAEEDPDSAFMDFFFLNRLLTKKDILVATGLRKDDYLEIFEENNGVRWLRTNCPANYRMSEHMKREDLLPGQRAMSELLWKWMRGITMTRLKISFTFLTGRFLEDDYWQDEAFQEETYVISVIELNEAMRLFFLHQYERQAKENPTY